MLVEHKPIVVAFVFVLTACGSEGSAGSDTPAQPHRDGLSAAVARGCPRPDWPGPWTACAEADWVGRIAAAAGYRIVDETGSALVAEGRGDSFYIWTTRHEIVPPVGRIVADEAWRRLGSAAGVAIYGDEHLWRWWSTEDTIFWIKAGPYEDSTVPGVGELDQLVAASLRTQPDHPDDPASAARAPR